DVSIPATDGNTTKCRFVEMYAVLAHRIEHAVAPRMRLVGLHWTEVFVPTFDESVGGIAQHVVVAVGEVGCQFPGAIAHKNRLLLEWLRLVPAAGDAVGLLDQPVVHEHLRLVADLHRGSID